MFKLFQNVLRLLGKLSITPVTLFTPTAVLFEDLGLCVDVPRYHVVVNGYKLYPIANNTAVALNKVTYRSY